MTAFRLLIFFCILAFPAQAANDKPLSAKPGSIAAVVNDRAITVSDLNDRMNLVIKSANLPDSPELREKLRRQLISVLIEEQIKLQAAAKEGVEVSDEQIDEGFANLAMQNKVEPDIFKQALEQRGVRIRTMRDQIRAEIAWGRLVSKKMRSKVDVTDADVAAEEARLKENVGRQQYRLAEIFLPVDQPTDDTKVQDAITRLHAQVAAKPEIFPQVARQFSASAGAASGGDMGWVHQGQLPDALDKALAGLEGGRVSQPIRSLSGYHILLLRETRMMQEGDLPKREALVDKIGTERLTRLARGYLQSLKAAAFIETRV